MQEYTSAALRGVLLDGTHRLLAGARGRKSASEVDKGADSCAQPFPCAQPFSCARDTRRCEVQDCHRASADRTRWKWMLTLPAPVRLQCRPTAHSEAHSHLVIGHPRDGCPIPAGRKAVTDQLLPIAKSEDNVHVASEVSFVTKQLNPKAYVQYSS